MLSPGDQIELLCFGYAICLELRVSGDDYEVVIALYNTKKKHSRKGHENSSDKVFATELSLML